MILCIAVFSIQCNRDYNAWFEFFIVCRLSAHFHVQYLDSDSLIKSHSVHCSINHVNNSSNIWPCYIYSSSEQFHPPHISMSSYNFAMQTNLSQNNMIMVGLMSHCRSLRANREIHWELDKRLGGIIIPCTIMSDMTLIGKVDARADKVHII